MMYGQTIIDLALGAVSPGYSESREPPHFFTNQKGTTMQTHQPQQKSKDEYPFPSRYGSHESMVVFKWSFLPQFVICQDEHGTYSTYANRLDNGLADPRRMDRRST